jgi:Mor family transcriptional regulator
MSAATLKRRPPHWPAFLSNLFDVVEQTMRKRGRGNDDARSDAQAIVIGIGFFLGGRQIYLPRCDALKSAMRNLEIARANNGRNKLALAQRFGLTPRTIEKIIAAQAQLGRARSQTSKLPNEVSPR